MAIGLGTPPLRGGGGIDFFRDKAPPLRGGITTISQNLGCKILECPPQRGGEDFSATKICHQNHRSWLQPFLSIMPPPTWVIFMKNTSFSKFWAPAALFDLKWRIFMKFWWKWRIFHQNDVILGQKAPQAPKIWNAPLTLGGHCTPLWGGIIDKKSLQPKHRDTKIKRRVPRCITF